jgi:hypothetical protein
MLMSRRGTGILANHAEKMLMFAFPDVVRGIKAYDKTWDFFFDKLKGPICYTPREVLVTASVKSPLRPAFSTATVHRQARLISGSRPG